MLKCWHDGNIDCYEDCELVENCPDRDRMLELYERGKEEGKLQERAEWEQEVAKKIIKYDRDIHEALPYVIDEVRKQTIEEAIKLADCNETECWDCAFGDALVVCRIKHLLKEQKNE